MISKKYGRLTVKEYAGNDKWRAAMYLCECECGNKVTIRGEHLRSGHTESCGCLHSERSRKHGLRKNRLYSIWNTMINRCTNQERKGSHLYVGRGIKVCEEWEDITNFIKWAEPGYREGLTLDRKDNNGDYEPDNCRWATPKEQARNTRRNINILHNGAVKTLAEWAEISGIKYATLLYRHHLGKSGEELFKPLKG